MAMCTHLIAKATRLVVFCMLLLLCNACSEEEAYDCFVGNPAEELDWLRDQIEVRKLAYLGDKAFLIQARAGKSTVFYFSVCAPAHSGSGLYDCAGNRIRTEIPPLTHQKIIWKAVGCPFLKLGTR